MSEDLSMFGTPRVQTAAEATEIKTLIRKLWELTYGSPVGPLEDDINSCRTFFDPVARGHKLRERLATLNPAPSDICALAANLGEPAVIEVDDGRFLVGVEARLLLDLLERYTNETGGVIVPEAAAAETLQRALATYRSWARHRLDQVIALRQGRGGEVMQATGVGIVLSLLVNRSTTPDRAIGRFTEAEVRQGVDQAVHAAAGSFANNISTGRSRSQSEQRLTGGYWLTEARRRLAHRLVVTEPSPGQASLIYIPEHYSDEVVDFIARDLSRRANLRQEDVAAGFDELVETFRRSASQLAGQGMTFERPADTARLRKKLLDRFQAAKGKNSAGTNTAAPG